MKTKTPASQLIQQRYSCRSYNGNVIDPKKREALEAFFAEESKTPFGSKPRFSIIAATEKDNNALNSLGTYGFIKGATAFITGALEKREYDLEDYGYQMEKNILFATELGINTCWLGGSFNKSAFIKKTMLHDNEYVPAVAAAGYSASRRRLMDAVTRMSVGATKRKPFHELFFIDDFEHPIQSENVGEYGFLFEMVQKAPSASNKQPWRIIWDKTSGKFHFYLHRTKNYYDRNKNLFKMADMQRLDMGIAMCHFELAEREIEKKGAWEVADPHISNLPERAEYLVTRTIINE